MERIQDHKNRKSTFLNRKAGLVKKTSELSMLCDIKACMIINESSHQGNNQVDYLSEELRNFAGVLEKKINNAKRKSEFLKSTNVRHSIGSSLSHQEIWDYPELMNKDLNQSTPWPISYVNPFIDINNNFFQEFTSDFQVNIPSGVNQMDAGMDTGLLTVDDYQFGNTDSMKTEAENWLANNGIGSSSTMQPMDPFIYSDSTHMPCGFR
ncbi:hypothetical protein RND71_024956 [Anisodus tanguticus]|uniref:MADS-box domain-containing protein n=1 Tax=Anisodus tanguticus TaxID=243964 RepID=A0AAE1RPA1_9SOLA|nr:hypothetical protein RND71_024956 [Anisodus tanguticus]